MSAGTGTEVHPNVRLRVLCKSHTRGRSLLMSVLRNSAEVSAESGLHRSLPAQRAASSRLSATCRGPPKQTSQPVAAGHSEQDRIWARAALDIQRAPSAPLRCCRSRSRTCPASCQPTAQR